MLRASKAIFPWLLVLSLVACGDDEAPPDGDDAGGGAGDDDDDVTPRDGGTSRPEDGGPRDTDAGPRPELDAGPPDLSICETWNAATDAATEGTWSGGDVPSCQPGDMDAAWRERALALTNAYRALAALPAIGLDATRNQKAQDCALMMDANDALSHTPPDTWACFTDDGDEGAGSSNIATTPAVASISLYMIDPGNETTLGHRRWILSNSIGPTGFGSTDEFSCMWTLGGSGAAGRDWTAFPPPGSFPIQAAGLVGLFPFANLDETGWSIQSDSIDFEGARVRVTEDGRTRPVDVTRLLPRFGSRDAIKIVSDGWTLAVGRTYRVEVSGASEAIDYAFTVVDCEDVR